jgi:hypothetical protein
VAGIKRVKLVESVDMHLHVREDSGFLNQNQPKPEQVAPGKPPAEQQAYIRIKTPGSFEYLFRSEKEGNLAVFSLPEPQPGGPASPADIFVTRHHEGRGATDQLMCERNRNRIGPRHRQGSDPSFRHRAARGPRG